MTHADLAVQIPIALAGMLAFGRWVLYWERRDAAERNRPDRPPELTYPEHERRRTVNHRPIGKGKKRRWLVQLATRMPSVRAGLLGARPGGVGSRAVRARLDGAPDR